LLMSPHRSLVVAKLPSDSKKSFLSLTSWYGDIRNAIIRLFGILPALAR
jgi:hypothetical protein